MWDFLDSVFGMGESAANVGNTKMKSLELDVVMEYNAKKHAYTQEDVQVAVLDNVKKDIMKNAGKGTEEFNPFAELKADKPQGENNGK